MNMNIIRSKYYDNITTAYESDFGKTNYATYILRLNVMD